MDIRAEEPRPIYDSTSSTDCQTASAGQSATQCSILGRGLLWWGEYRWQVADPAGMLNPTRALPHAAGGMRAAVICASQGVSASR